MDASLECQSCPLPGSDCTTQGATLETLRLEPGYWRISNDSLDVRACPDQKEEESSACTGNPDSPCKPGLTGIYCTLCVNKSGTYFSKEDASCRPCDEGPIERWLIAGWTIGAACVVGLIFGLGYLVMPGSAKTSVAVMSIDVNVADVEANPTSPAAASPPPSPPSLVQMSQCPSVPRPRPNSHPSSLQSFVPFSHLRSLQSAPLVGSLAHKSVLKKASIRHFT